jgi:hypothetical protein
MHTARTLPCCPALGLTAAAFGAALLSESSERIAAASRSAAGGRDHRGGVFPAVPTRGGLRHGQVVGAGSARSKRPLRSGDLGVSPCPRPGASLDSFSVISVGAQP